MVRDSVPTVLFVADEDDLALYTTGLQADGIALAPARTAEEAVFIAGIRRFDAIIVVVVALQREGWAPCEVLRTHPVTAGTPLIALTASVRPDGANRLRAQHLGCAAFAAKPCPPDELAAIVRRVIAGDRGIEHVRLVRDEPPV
jgi:DNA-binding response OmpR family regulator